MTTLELRGRINEKGKLEVELPEGLPAGEVTVRVDVPNAADNWQDQAWTEAEITALMQPKRKTIKELIEWLDANPPTEPWGDLRDDEDAAEYIHRMRHQTSFTLEEPGESEA